MEEEERISPKPVVGFSIINGLPDSAEQPWIKSHQSILNDFPWLQSTEITHGASRLYLWGHDLPARSYYISVDHNLWVLSGSPFGNYSWKDLLQKFKDINERFEVPWEGRWLLLRVSSDGKTWSVWNDWSGSVPAFYCSWRDGGMVSTLETICVDGAKLGSTDFSRRGLVELLMFGHFLGTDTLYSSLKVIAPDTCSTWAEGKLTKSVWLGSVQASDQNYTTNCKILLEKMHQLSVEAITASSTGENASVLLPLSSGMDSRVIACIAKDLNIPIEAYTYGPKSWTEVFFASKVARALEIPWQRVEMGVNYTADFIRPWLNWFGSSHHAHGMYQFPFLNQIKSKRGLIPNGFYGNNMAGGDHPNDCLFEPKKEIIERFCGYGTCWDKKSLEELLDFNPGPYYLEMNEILQNQVSLVSDWDFYQQMNIVDMWNRQARSIFYQPTMYSYYGYERSPFMYRKYARFCMSLPSKMLRKRNLQIEMLERYWPDVARIPSTFRPQRGVARKWQGARHIIALKLPRTLRPLMGPTPVNKMELDCAQARGWDVFYPITPDVTQTFPLKREPILQSCKNAMQGDQLSLVRAMVVQPIIFRLLQDAIRP